MARMQPIVAGHARAGRSLTKPVVSALHDIDGGRAEGAGGYNRRSVPPAPSNADTPPLSTANTELSSRPPGRGLLRGTAIAAIVLLFILVPFVLFERDVNDWALQRLRPSAPPSSIAAVVVALLAADVVLPVPSSLVSTASGVSLGFVLGVAASVCGMTLGALAGYLLGRTLGLPIAGHFMSSRDLEIVSARLRSRTTGALVAMRAVPVLAEGSVLMAGVLRVDPWRFFISTFFANVGISVAYGAVGALALSVNSFALAFAGAIAIPAVILGVAGRVARRQVRRSI
jgi:uncharacterized membrane protein YdjX (TVP38/TMEM64 family)